MAHHKQKIAELIPVSFDGSRKGEQTEVRFTHLGVVSEFAWFDSCSNARDFYITGSQRHLIMTGEREPNPNEH